MEKISINKNGLGIFKGIGKKEATQKNSLSTNPFGISFKGNVIQADVFEAAKTASNKIRINEKIANGGRVLKSAIVGGINSFSNAVKERANSIIAFGRRTKERISSAIDFANSYDVGEGIKNAFRSISNRITAGNEYSVKNLTKKPVSELESMLRSELA